MTNYLKRKDANQNEVVEALKAVGASVTDLSRFGEGFPDLVVGFRNENYLFEVKRKKGERLTDAEFRWHNEWRGMAWIVWDVDQALRIIGATE